MVKLPGFYQPSSVRGGISAFLLAVHRLCGVVEGRLSHFLPRWPRPGWQSAISQGKISWNTPPWVGIELGPRGGQPVSYHDCQIRHLFFTSYSLARSTTGGSVSMLCLIVRLVPREYRINVGSSYSLPWSGIKARFSCYRAQHSTTELSRYPAIPLSCHPATPLFRYPVSNLERTGLGAISPHSQ